MVEIEAIGKRLKKTGEVLFEKQITPVRFISGQDSGLPILEAEILLNDLEDHPHAFVLACVMDRQIKAERAWQIPHWFREKLGGFSMDILKELSRADIHRLMTDPEPLHRYVNEMSENFYLAVQHISNEYAGKASEIWAGKPSSAEVVYRFLEFRGVGPKIATMAANILARDFKVPFSDRYSIDISVDTHVRRVFVRLGLCKKGVPNEQFIYRARVLNPDFPGVIDLPCWEIGRSYCKPGTPLCSSCYMSDICPTAQDPSLLSCN